MKLFLHGLLACLLCVLVTRCEDEENARILASKHILNQYLVEGRDVTVEYRLYNVGSSAALDVELSDDGFADVDFEKINGLAAVYWDRIGPGANVTHAIVVKPLRPGFFNFSSAEISYLPSESAKDKITGFTSSPGEGEIVNVKDFDRRFSPHFLDWAVFAVMTLPSLGIPFLLWYKSMVKYDPAYIKK